jgi:glucose uptake protein GlcU
VHWTFTFLECLTTGTPHCFLSCSHTHTVCVCDAGNILSILATERVGVAVAYPLFQCGLLVAGMWGILLFEELERPCIPAYLLSGLALILGATFLALAK